jgi:hypothetical protein
MTDGIADPKICGFSGSFRACVVLGALEGVLGALAVGLGALETALCALLEGAALLLFWAAADEPSSAATMATPASAREFNPETPVTMRFFP